jgi:predicted nucleic acid-binding protein
VRFAVHRLDPRLQALVVAHDHDEQPAAETWRRVGESAQELGLPRPSYHTIRELVRHERLRRRARTATRKAALGVVGALATSRAVDLPIALDALAHARAKERLVSDRHKPP